MRRISTASSRPRTAPDCTDVLKIGRAPLAFDTGPCLRFPNQAQFHPLKYLAGVAQAIERGGGRIYAGTHATKVTGGENAEVATERGTVRAGHVVVATNVPINDLVVIHTKQAPYMTYVIGARVPRNAVTAALYWDTGDPYHYVRLQPIDADHDLLIVGGEDHKSGQADDIEQRHPRLEAWARERFPSMGEVQYTWAGQVMETIDGLAFIGRNPMDHKNVYVVTGDSGMGMTHGTIAGMLITDLILGRHNAWESLYDPGRITLRASGVRQRSDQHRGAVRRLPDRRGCRVGRSDREGFGRGNSAWCPKSSPSTATPPASCTNVQPSARILGASWRGIPPKKRGIARAMARVSTSSAR